VSGVYVYSFFFQAEDGIRDRTVTGVQTVLFRSPVMSDPIQLGAGQELTQQVVVAGVPFSLDTVRVERRSTCSMRTDSALATYAIDRKSTRLNSSHRTISYAVFCLKKKKIQHRHT